MTEEVKENETSELNVPMQTISKERIEENEKIMEETKRILTPPEGQVLAGLRSFCPIHGDITRASRIVKYTTYMKSEVDGKVHPFSSSDAICLACVSDWWRKNIVANYPKDEKGNDQVVKIAPVFISQEEYNKLVDDQKKAAEEAQGMVESANEAPAEEKAE